MRKKELYLVCLTVLPFMICTGIVYSILSLYMAEVGLTKSQIGFLYTSGAVAGAIGAPFLGGLADRFGRKRVLLFSMGGFAFVFTGYALSRGYLPLLFVQIGEGFSWAALAASTTALVADLSTEETRGKAMGIYNMTWNVGWIAGPSMGGLISDHMGFTFTFTLCTGLTVFGLILAMFFIPAKTPGRGAKQALESGSPGA
jgi:DHA1 family multidrug resistance protein-like MFS transporter